MSVKDGLSAIANEVLAEVQKEAEAIVLTAKNEAREALKTAKQQADKNYQTILNQAVARAEAEKRRIASVTEVEMRNYLLQAKEELVNAAFDKALVRLKEFVATEEYRRYLLKLIREVAKVLGQKSLVIQVNAKGQSMAYPRRVGSPIQKAKLRIKITR